MFTEDTLNTIKNTTFLITGGAGFIGSNLTEKLLSLNAGKVIVFDDLSTGFYENIKPFEDQSNFEFIQASITDKEACLNAFNGVDIIFQMAALGSVPRSIDNPQATNQVNVNGFLNVVWAAKESKVKKVVYSSSSSIYGDDKTLPKVEHSVGNPLSPYAVSKRANELYAQTFSNLFDLDIVGLRYFNVFGPKQNIKGAYAAVIPIFISNLLSNTPCYINGDGLISRDFTFIDNVVHANILAAFSKLENKHEIFNIAMGSQLSLNDLYDHLEGEIKTGLSPIHREKRIGDIDSSMADINKAKSLLNYAPVTSVESGLTRTVNWYKMQFAEI